MPPTPSTKTAAIRAFTWTPLIALAATQALETGERQALAQAVDGIRESFGVSDAAIGLLPTAAVLVGVLAAIPMGIATDRTTRTRLVAATTLVWTLGVTLAGISTTFAMLLGARVLLGALEAGAPPSVSLLADYYPVRERAKVMGLYQAGALIGGLFGLIAGGVLVARLGWRSPFIILAPLGIAVSWWVSRCPEPGRGDRDAEELEARTAEATQHASTAELAAQIEIADPADDPGDVSLADALRRLRPIRTFWLGLVAIGVANLLLTSLQFWGVEFFKRVHDLGPEKAGLITSLLGAGAAAGVLGGGPLADRLVRRGVEAGRVIVVAIGALGGTAVLVPAFASNDLLVTTPLFVLGGFFLTLPLAPAEALLADVVDADLRGRSGSIRSIVRGLSQTGALIVGLISSAVGLQRALVVFTPVYAVGGLLVLLALKTYGPDHARALEASRRVSY